jgi:hypothetical protein
VRALGILYRSLERSAQIQVSILRELAYRLAMKQLPIIRTIASRKPGSRSLPLIVSLTTTPKRLFQKTDIGIATLLSQGCRPDRVILWVSDEVKDRPLHKDSDGKLTPYKQWARFSPGILGPSHLLFPTGVGGVLYPPHSLAEEVFHVDAFQRLCPFADDIWFKAMALLQGISCQKVKPYWQTLLAVHGTQQGHLFATNIENNDSQLRATFDAYDLYRLL